MDRRQFLTNSTGVLLAVGSHSALSLPTRVNGAGLINPGLSEQEWASLSAVQNHLLPTEGHAPGASNVNAKGYLYAVLADPDYDQSDRKFIKRGIQSLEKLIQKESKQPFSKLSENEREHYLRIYEDSTEGYAWISTILNYVLEALLTDPIYGGNPNGIGWQWLEHTPGFPRPTVKYFDL